jgi:dienelactone hydrolase
MRRRLLQVAWLLVFAAEFARAQPAEPAPYTELFYPSGKLRIQAYLYRPEGSGPFPVVVYNHGSRVGHDRESVPFVHIGAMLVRAGYVVLVPERRGYGKSDGATWREEAGNDSARIMQRLEEETDDVMAGVDHLRTLEFVDAKRLAIMGWSFGGIVTMLASSRGTTFAAAVDQAGGALSWDGSAPMRAALTAAARRTTTPTLLQVASNDRTTDSITTLAAILDERRVPSRAIVYPPFTPRDRGLPIAPGHMVFSAQGTAVWERDVLDFLGRYLGAH